MYRTIHKKTQAETREERVPTQGGDTWTPGKRPELQEGVVGESDTSRQMTKRGDKGTRFAGRETTGDWGEVARGRGLSRGGRRRSLSKKERKIMEELWGADASDSEFGSSSDDEPLWRTKKRAKKKKEKRRRRAGVYGKGFNEGIKYVFGENKDVVLNREKILKVLKELGGKDVEKWDLSKIFDKLGVMAIKLPEANYLGIVKCVEWDVLNAVDVGSRNGESTGEWKKEFEELEEIIKEDMAFLFRILEDGALFNPAALAQLLRAASAARMKNIMAWPDAYEKYCERLLKNEELRSYGKEGGEIGVTPARGEGGGDWKRRETAGTCRRYNLERRGCTLRGCRFYHACLGCGQRGHIVFKCPFFLDKWEEFKRANGGKGKRHA